MTYFLTLISSGHHIRGLSRSCTFGSGGWHLQTDRGKDLGPHRDQGNDLLLEGKFWGRLRTGGAWADDAKLLADEIKVRVDSILTLPEEAEKPMVEVTTIKRRVLAVAIREVRREIFA